MSIAVAVPNPSSPALRLNVLGGFSLQSGADLVLMPRQAERVLALLAVSNREQRREGLVGQLWPELPQERAQACLRSALWRVRRVAPGALATSATTVRIPASVSIDLEDATTVSRPSEHSSCDGLRSLDLLRNDLLPEWDDEWVVFERERVRQLRIHALERLSQSLAAGGRFADAIEAACVAIAAEPLRDSAHAALISAHMREGNRGDAVRAFQRYARLMKVELGVPPSSRVAMLLKGAERP